MLALMKPTQIKSFPMDNNVGSLILGFQQIRAKPKYSALSTFNVTTGRSILAFKSHCALPHVEATTAIFSS